MLNMDALRAACRSTRQDRLEVFFGPLAEEMEEFEINTPEREAAFVAQIAHESAGLQYVRELASGSAYEGRKDLGNTEPGDGPRFRGRGLIQITGRKMYGLCGEALGLELLEHPELLEQTRQACRSAAWFWRTGAGLNLSKRARAHGVPEGCDLNDLADAGDFLGITLAINGGTNGQQDRLARWESVKEVIA